MKKILMLATVAGLMTSPTALAQDSCLFFDIRDYSTPPDQIITPPTYPYTVGALNNGGPGDGQVLRISPTFLSGFQTNPICANGWPNNDLDGNNSTGCFWLFMDVNLGLGGATGSISTIGIDFNTTPPATVRNTMLSLTYAWEPIVSAAPWSATGGSLVGLSWLGADTTWTAAFPSTVVPIARYRIGKLCVVGGARCVTYGAGFEANSTYTVKMSVNSHLITRAFTGGPTDPVEDVAFGYAGGAPEVPYAAGNVVGATSVLPDATIIVNLKGDNTGDGRVLNNDNAGFLTARLAGTTGATQRQVYMNDFNGDRRVLVTDNAGYVAAKANSLLGP